MDLSGNQSVIAALVETLLTVHDLAREMPDLSGTSRNFHVGNNVPQTEAGRALA